MLKRISVLLLVASSIAPAFGQETKTFTYKKTKQGDLEIVVHYPPGWKETDRRPGIVFFFGGGWTSGKMEQFEPQAKHLASRGMVAARADYRVRSRHNVTPKECVEDAKSAVRWMRQNAAKLGIDANRIVAAGGSAGGHIAACTALTPGLDAEGEDAKVSSIPNALVLFNPVLRFSGIPQLMSRIGNDEALGKAISPTLHLKKDSPPTLIFFGTADKLAIMGDEFMKKSKELGHRADLFTAEGQGHGFFNRPPWQEKTTQRMDEFLVSIGYLEGKATSTTETAAADSTAPAKKTEPIRKLTVEVDPILGSKWSAKPGVRIASDEKELSKLFGEDTAKQIAGKIDFAKEDLVHVAWGSAGPPFGTLRHETKDGKEGKAITFFVRQPKTLVQGQAFRMGNDFFAVPKKANVQFGGAR